MAKLDAALSAPAPKFMRGCTGAVNPAMVSMTEAHLFWSFCASASPVLPIS